MALPTTHPILAELRSSTSSASQVTALRALKNEIIGHEGKKRMWIGLGVLAPLARILSTPKANEKRRESSGNRSASFGKASLGRTDEEEARLQAIIIVGSLASGGPAFIPSIRASAVIASLLVLLSTNESSAKLVLAALRTLNCIANASSLQSLHAEDHTKGLVPSLYTDEHLASIVQLLSQPSSSHTAQSQISLTAALIARTCQDESQRILLVQAGILEALASRLSTFIGATDYMLCSPRSAYRSPPYPEISSAIARSWLAPVLAAIGTIVDISRSRITILLSTPALTAVLLRSEADIAVPYKKTGQWAHQGNNTPGIHQPSSSRLEYLLPQLPAFPTKRTLPETNHHPPIGSSANLAKQPRSLKVLDRPHDAVRDQALAPPQDEGNALVAWLIYIARAESGITRLMAAWLIGLFYGSGVIDKRRDVSFAMLLVPLLVRMLEKDVRSMANGHLGCEGNPFRSPMPKSPVQAPAILAMLTLDSSELQRAAVEAGAIKTLAQLLKESYDPLPTKSGTTQWTAEPEAEDSFDNSHESVCVGDFTATATAYQMVKLRESVLRALASIASISDDYRKTIIENGVVPFVIESLKPELKLPSSEENHQDEVDVDSQNLPNHPMNPIGVLVAACATAKSLTRSVSTLRTNLMDAGLAAPLFVLLQHPDVRVQTVATEVVSNLILEFSPMREAALNADVHKILCDHAHSADAGLRFNAVWALGHLVCSAPKSLKKDCLSDLGPEWLVQIICDNGDDSACSFRRARSDGEASVSTPLAMGTPNAAGEQVDLLNATDGSADRGHGVDEDDDDDFNMTEPEAERQRPHQSRGGAAQRPGESTATSPGQADHLAMQKQGLNFIRNLICGSDAAEMIDYVFEEVGQDKVFEMLINKLRPRVVNAFNRDRRSSENGPRQVQAQSDMVKMAVYTIINVAAGSPRHRQVVLSQTELMKLILSLFSHPNHEIRTGCVWVVINVTWLEDPSSDQANCKQRVLQCKRLGVMEKLKMLESDPELDVRERTRTATYQMTQFDR